MIGWCAGYFPKWRKDRSPRRKALVRGAGLVPLLFVVQTVRVVWKADDIQRVQDMTAPEVERMLNRPELARNRFILGAIAASFRADAAVLHRIATTKLGELHEPMGIRGDGNEQARTGGDAFGSEYTWSGAGENRNMPTGVRGGWLPTPNGTYWAT